MSAPQSDAIRLLIVDDDPAAAELVLAALEREEVAVRAEILDWIDEVRRRLDAGGLDVIVADYQLRGWRGTDVLGMVRERELDIPVILVTGSLGEEFADVCLREGATDFVLKHHLARLAPAVKRAVNLKRVQQERAAALERVRLLSVAIDQSPAAVFITDTMGRIEYVNRRFEGEVAEAPEVVPEGRSRPVRGTVLVVEDDEGVRRSAVRALERIGCTVLSAASAAEALALLESGGPRPDLIFTDVVMPGMTGPELAVRIQEPMPGAKVLFTTGYTSEWRFVTGSWTIRPTSSRSPTRWAISPTRRGACSAPERRPSFPPARPHVGWPADEPVRAPNVPERDPLERNRSMARTNRILRAATAALAALIMLPVVVSAQADMAPTNDLPNPYRTIEGWAKMPQGRSWGSTSSVEVDIDGVSIWVAERCSTNQRGCLVNSNLDPVLKFDADGNMVESFGAGLIVWPHGIDVDHEGNVWVVDGQDNRPQGRRGGPPPSPADMPEHVYGHQVIKFSPTGEVLMKLGVEGGVPMNQQAAAGPRRDFFWQPNDVYVAGNGDIFVAEGHGSGRNRIIKFNSRGEYLFEWGGTGDQPGQFNQPHALAMDSRGRLFVADRGNNRIQIFTQDGAFLDEWYQFSRLSGIYIDRNDILYGADSESGSVNPAHGSWTRGIRVGSARTGEVMYLIPDPNPDCSGTCTAEGVVADRNGVIYGAEVGPAPGRLQRYVQQ